MGVAASRGWSRLTVDDRHIAARLGAAGWGAFFLWVGIATIAQWDWGVGLIGVGLITLTTQAARSQFGLPIEVFWVVAGLLFALGGIWELFQVEVRLGPVLLVVIGLVLLVSALRAPSRRTDDKEETGRS